MDFKKNVIDSHMHFSSVYNDKGETMFDVFDKYQKDFNMRTINICSIPYSYADVSNNILAAIYKLKNEKVFAYGGITFNEFPVKLPVTKGLEPLTQYNELLDLGFDGIKLYDCKPTELKLLGIFPNDPFYEDMFARAEKQGTHIIWHVGDPDTFWDAEKAPAWTHDRGYFYGDGTFPTNEQLYGAVFDVLKKHPKLNITFAHFFFWADYPQKLVDLFETYENVSIDLVPGSEMYSGILNNYEFYKEFFVKYQDRILYGTDATFGLNEFYWSTLATEVYKAVATDEEIEIYGVKGKGLNLPEDVCKKILCDNFLRLSKKTTPKKTDKQLLKKYIEKYLCYVTDESAKKYIEEFYKTL